MFSKKSIVVLVVLLAMSYVISALANPPVNPPETGGLPGCTAENEALKAENAALQSQLAAVEEAAEEASKQCDSDKAALQAAIDAGDAALQAQLDANAELQAQVNQLEADKRALQEEIEFVVEEMQAQIDACNSDKSTLQERFDYCLWLEDYYKEGYEYCCGDHCTYPPEP